MKKPKPKVVKKKKKASRASLMKKAWHVFSIYIRKSQADFAGYVNCCCCGKAYLWNSGEIHSGHWIHNKLDFDERNIHPECRNCNFKYNMNTNTLYAIFMAKKYGADEMDSIRQDANKYGNSYSVENLNKIIQIYGELIKD